MEARRDPDQDFAQQVKEKAERLLRARRRGDSFWSGLVHVGTLSWMFIIPVVLGAFAGRWLATLGYSKLIALMPILCGLTMGVYIVVRQLSRGNGEGER
jgi:ATP synthase protein I